MDESNEILTDIKQRLNIESSTTEFDTDVIFEINSAFFVLNSLGIGPEEPFSVDEDTTWDSFETSVPLSTVGEYIYLKSKLVFDPPPSTSVQQSYQNRLDEIAFYMNVFVDNGGGSVTG